MKITVLGAGSWGTTLACLLADNGHDVSLWEFDKNVADKLNSERLIPFIGGANIPGLPIPCGWPIVAVGLIMEAIGMAIIRRIVDIEV